MSELDDHSAKIAEIENEIPLFRHRTCGTVKFEDVGIDGTVSDIKYLYWMEWTRAQYYRDIGLNINADNFLKEYLHVIVHTTYDIFEKARFFEDYEVLTRTVIVKNSSMVLDHVIRNTGGKILAKMTVVIVFLDYVTRKSHPISNEIRELIKGYERETVVFANG